MKYHKSTLSNGIRLITVPMPSLESVTIEVAFNVGARHEPEELNGISHFLEHVIMDGGKKYKNAQAIWTAIDKVGGIVNASTSQEVTNYYVKMHADHAKLGFELLSDLIINTQFAPKDIKKERTVILDEISMGNDNPKRVVGKLFGKLLYSGDPLSREVIGTKKIVSGMERADLLSYKKDHYVAENVVIAIAGGVTHAQMLSLAENYFSKLPSDLARKTGNEKISVKLPKDRVNLIRRDIEQTTFILGFPGLPAGDERKYAEGILDTILGGGASSRLFSLIREKHALAYSVGTDTDHMRGVGEFAGFAGTDPKNATKALSLMMKEFEKMKKATTAKITSEEFNKAISYAKGHVALAMENSFWIASNLGHKELLLGSIETPAEYLAKLEKIQVDEVIAIANQLFDFNKMVLAIIGPHKDPKPFEKLVY